MSEERRKRQQERQPKPAEPRNVKKTAVYAAIIALFAGAYYAGWYHSNHKYDSFAKCLASKQAKMYGLSWCPHCVEQKQEFGESFHYVPYVECGIAETHEETAACKIQGIKLFPTWQFGNEPPKEGVLSLDALSDKTGCSLP